MFFISLECSVELVSKKEIESFVITANSLSSNNKDFELDFDIRIKYKSDTYQNYRINSTYISSDTDSSPNLSISLTLTTNSNFSENNVLNQRDSLTSLYDLVDATAISGPA